jgi:hypothetical protein
LRRAPFIRKAGDRRRYERDVRVRSASRSTIESGLVATGDIDLLYDARRHISLAVTGLATEGLIGLLKKVDGSFAPAKPRGFRAANRDGYLVDLIRPEAKNLFRDTRSIALSDLPDDLEGAAIDERGYPARLVALDPRAFALHKAWISRREDREAVKAVRDLEQAKAAASIATRYLKKSFDSPELSALPVGLRDMVAMLGNADPPKANSPNW